MKERFNFDLYALYISVTFLKKKKIYIYLVHQKKLITSLDPYSLESTASKLIIIGHRSARVLLR